MWLTSLRRPAKRGPGGRPFRPRLELLEGRDVPSTLTVTNNHDSGAGSLRATIAAATGSTFVGNQAVGAVKEREPDGGAIFNAATATLIGCTFTGNRSIGSDGGTLTSGFDFLGAAGGGAITNSFGATLTVVNSTFT